MYFVCCFHSPWNPWLLGRSKAWKSCCRRRSQHQGTKMWACLQDHILTQMKSLKVHRKANVLPQGHHLRGQGQHRQQSLQSLLQNFQRKFQSLLLQWPWKTTLDHLHLSGMAMQWLAAPATTIVTSVCAAAADPAIAVTDAEAQVEGEHTGTSRKATKEATGTTVRAQDARPAVAARAESQSRENPQARTRSAATRNLALFCYSSFCLQACKHVCDRLGEDPGYRGDNWVLLCPLLNRPVFDHEFGLFSVQSTLSGESCGHHGGYEVVDLVDSEVIEPPWDQIIEIKVW